MKTPRFWKALEVCPRTLRETWQRKVESEFDEVIRFLRGNGAIASHYPDPERPPGGGPWPEYEVVPRSLGQFVGIYPNWAKPMITLSTAQVMIHEPHWPAIRQNLAPALGFQLEKERVAGCINTFRLGHHQQSSGKKLPVYFLVCHDQERFFQDAMTLMLHVDRPCLLLTPAETWMNPAIRDRLHRKRIATLNLSDHIEMNRLGMALDKPLGELIAHSTVAPEPTPSIFRRQGRQWELAYAGKTVHVGHLKGLTAIAYLLKHPGRQLSVMDVEAFAEGKPAVAAGSAGEVLDQPAITKYRRECDELREELAEAMKYNDLGRQESLQAQLAMLEHQLTGALGLGGRQRTAHDDLELCRKRIRNIIDRAVRQIQLVHVALGRHLASSLSMGRVLCYQTESCPDWVI